MDTSSLGVDINPCKEHPFLICGCQISWIDHRFSLVCSPLEPIIALLYLGSQWAGNQEPGYEAKPISNSYIHAVLLVA